MSRIGKPRAPLAGPPAGSEPPVPPAGSDRPVPPAGSDRPVPPTAGIRPMAVDARKVLLTGTALFGLAFVVLLPFWTWLGEHQHRVWLWTALAGTVLGLLALPLVRKHTDEGRLG